MYKNSPVIVGLDIGTTKVVAIAGVRSNDGRINIVGFGQAESKGVENGLVLNIDQCVHSIETAIHNCLESNPHLEINNVYVGIAGRHIKSLQNRGERIRADIESLITKVEIDLLIEDQKKTYLPPGAKIIDIVPQDFTVDEKRNITNPVGMRGTKIGANFHIITGGKEDIQSINMCVKRANLNTSDIVLQPMASAAAVMSDEELEMGVAIVDIGGGTTDMAVFKEGILHHTQVIPFAGEDITLDIKNSLGILKTQAEKMKVKYGAVLESDQHKSTYITIPGIKGHNAKEIAYNSLAKIIQSKVHEIMLVVRNELEMIGLADQLHGGIILTGGGAHLIGIKAYTEFITKMNVRIGYPDEHMYFDKTAEVLRDPKYSTCIGLVLKGFSDLDSGKNALHSDYENNKIFMPPSKKELNVRDIIEDEKPYVAPEEEVHSDFDQFIPDLPDELIPDKPIDVNKRKLFINKVFSTIKKNVLDLFEGGDEYEFPDK